MLEKVFWEKLKEAESEELRKCTTLVGPHRDDVKIGLNGRGLRKYGSQGQKRLFAILAKLSEQTYVETELEEPCVLMLDDVFSEFDSEITEKLQKLLEGGRQVFVTSPVSLEWERSHAPRVFYLRAGYAST
jgi:DNA replication and repair protein RecF